MGIETIILGTLALGGAGLGAFSSAQQAKSANQRAEQLHASQRRAARIQANQIAAQSSLEKQKTARQAHSIRSTIRTAAGEQLGLGGTYEALLRQADLDQLTNEEIIQQNALLATQNVFSRVPPAPQEQNTTLAMILGGLGGFQSGLNIGSSAGLIGGTLPKPQRTGGT